MLGRRKFLKYTGIAGAIVTLGGPLKVSPNPLGENQLLAAEEPVTMTKVMDLPSVDKLIITSLTDNYYDALRKDEKVAYRFGIWNQDQFPPIICEMGLSYYVEAISGSEHRHLMCDFSYTSNALLHNVDLLGINPSKVEALVLSHGHKDHWGGVYLIIIACLCTKICLYMSERRRFTQGGLYSRTVARFISTNWMRTR